MSTGLFSCTDRISEVLAFQTQRLNPIDMWDSYFAKAIGDARVGIYVGSLVVNLEHLSRSGIIIDRHPLIPNHGHAPNFAGMEPAYMDMGCHSIGKLQIEVRHILDMALYVGVSLYLDPFRLFTQHIK